MMCDPLVGVGPAGAGSEETGPSTAGGGQLVVGSWNMSHWTPAKARTVFAEVGADVLALQETHLAALPLEWAHGTARAAGWTLLHGHPVRPVADRTAGKSCGVGFVARAGVAAAAALPVGAPWRWLHLAGRLHGVRLEPRLGLPRGLLLLSVYAPLQTGHARVERRKFVDAFLQVTHHLDLQIPTLLLGDFNGSAIPGRDFLGETSLRRPACPVLEHLLGPGGAWVDVHAALLSEPLPWTFQSLDRAGKLSASRIDLVLANHAAMAMVKGARVMSDVRDGGHSPVVVELAWAGPVALDWQRPRAKLPELLTLSTRELLASEKWTELLERWGASTVVQRALHLQSEHTASSLSESLLASLHHLVELAGGWIVRPSERRQAYDSESIRRARRRLADLHHLEQLTRVAECAGVGCWPHRWDQLCSSLERRGVRLPRSTAIHLRAAVIREIAAARAEVDKLNRDMRAIRHARWRDARPRLWVERPGVVYHWLQAPSAAWGCTPLVDERGQQCLTVDAVDRAVRGFWVDQVLRQHSAVDDSERWHLFAASEFYGHIPVLQWPHAPWTGVRVAAALRSMREGASPGLPNVPIAVWKALPVAWLDAVARLLNLIEDEGAWPTEWLDAYVVMIPKAAGGTRPRDQRPITVLPMVYRLWSKGVVLEWSPVLQQAYLGQAAMGFRAQAGTLHVAQLLSDLIVLSRQRQSELWLMSFDIEKCYDSVPWWALFGVMRRTGIAEAVVQSFEAYYRGLRRCFRYGQVDGAVWQAANSLMQGCPASPDELNLLMEPFHRWALAAGLGVDTGVGRVPSVSFADDVALVARDQSEAEVLIAAYLRWCDLLQLKVTKTQVWSNTGVEHEVLVGERRIRTVSTFKIVGVVLGSDERQATELHIAPRLTKATATLQRLKALDLPSSLCCLLWRTAVLPQALYGCEVRNVTPPDLHKLSSASKAALGPKFPIRVNCWRAPEILSGLPLGESEVRDPVLELRDRQLRWWHLVSNLPSLVGAVHRQVSWQQNVWREPTAALASALRTVGWRVRRNTACLRGALWPLVEPEPIYPGEVLLQPVDAFALPGAVYTDGSVLQAGGAAAIQPDEEQVRTARVVTPHSSTQCELVALALAMELQPPHILSDSLAALHMLRAWGRWSPQRVLQTVDRALVRQVIHLARQLGSPPRLEKVKAHDEDAIASGHPKALGNDEADMWAKRAASEAGHCVWADTSGLYGDPVVLEDPDGSPILDVRQSLAAVWWERRNRSRSQARVVLDQMYPPDVEVAWAVSANIFRRPVTQGVAFVHPIHPKVIKWLARVRTGCLATRMRLVGHGMSRGSTDCPACGDVNEDDAHVLFGCTATGTADWLATFQEVWLSAASAVHEDLPPPPSTWLERHRYMLRAALIPITLPADCGVPEAVAPRFLHALHRALAESTAEYLRRREELRGTGGEPLEAGSDHDAMRALEGTQSLPAERRLSVRDLREAERARREAQQQRGTPSQGTPSTPAVPVSGERRRRWLRQRLVTLVSDEMVVCSLSEGVESVVVLELFERTTGEVYTDTPGTLLRARLLGLAKALSNIAKDVTLDPPLVQSRRREGVVWNRRPLEAVDVAAWRHNEEAAEAFAIPVQRLSKQMAATNKELAQWLCDHRYLQSAPLASGESGMALLILWEVDHGKAFPSRGGESLTAALLGFTKRMRLCVANEPRLAWLTSADVHASLASGLAPSHHRRWTVRVVAPATTDPQGWYLEFLARWRAYTRTLVCPPGSRPMSEVTPEQLFRIRPGLQQLSPVVSGGADEASSSSTLLRRQTVSESERLAGMPHERPGAGDSARMGTVSPCANDSRAASGERVESTPEDHPRELDAAPMTTTPSRRKRKGAPALADAPISAVASPVTSTGDTLEAASLIFSWASARRPAESPIPEQPPPRKQRRPNPPMARNASNAATPAISTSEVPTQQRNPDAAARPTPKRRRQHTPPSSLPDVDQHAPTLQHATDLTTAPTPKRRKVDLRQWFLPISTAASSSTSMEENSQSAVEPGHGRAVQSPPT